MKWIECQTCRAQIPVADEENHEEWAEPCELCGGYTWDLFQEKIGLVEMEKLIEEAEEKMAKNRRTELEKTLRVMGMAKI